MLPIRHDKRSAVCAVRGESRIVNLEGRRTIVARDASSAGVAAIDAYPVPGPKVVSLDIQPGPKDSGRPADRFLALICDVSS